MAFKISVQHFLNENLKAYKINGESFFAVYMLVTAQRKTTRIKSLQFQEIYTPAEFKKLVKSKPALGECQLVQTLVEAQMAEFKAFDTLLFSSFMNFMPKHALVESRFFEMGVGQVLSVHPLLFHRGMHRLNYSEDGLSFIDWFHPTNQHVIKKHLFAIGIKADKILVMNRIVLLAFFDLLKVLSSSLNKYSELKARYFHTMDSLEQAILAERRKLK